MTIGWKEDLSPAAKKAVERWAEPCRNVFSTLRAGYRVDLLHLCESSILEPVDLTFALEELGVAFDDEGLVLRDRARQCLFDWACNPTSGIVQEGALYGMCNMDGPTQEELVTILKFTVSPAVKRIVEEMLESSRYG